MPGILLVEILRKLSQLSSTLKMQPERACARSARSFFLYFSLAGVERGGLRTLTILVMLLSFGNTGGNKIVPDVRMKSLF